MLHGVVDELRRRPHVELQRASSGAITPNRAPPKAPRRAASLPGTVAPPRILGRSHKEEARRGWAAARFSGTVRVELGGFLPACGRLAAGRRAAGRLANRLFRAALAGRRFACRRLAARRFACRRLARRALLRGLLAAGGLPCGGLARAGLLARRLLARRALFLGHSVLLPCPFGVRGHGRAEKPADAPPAGVASLIHQRAQSR